MIKLVTKVHEKPVLSDRVDLRTLGKKHLRLLCRKNQGDNDRLLDARSYASKTKTSSHIGDHGSAMGCGLVRSDTSERDIQVGFHCRNLRVVINGYRARRRDVGNGNHVAKLGAPAIGTNTHDSAKVAGDILAAAVPAKVKGTDGAAYMITTLDPFDVHVTSLASSNVPVSSPCLKAIGVVADDLMTELARMPRATAVCAKLTATRCAAAQLWLLCLGPQTVGDTWTSIPIRDIMCRLEAVSVSAIYENRGRRRVGCSISGRRVGRGRRGVDKLKGGVAVGYRTPTNPRILSQPSSLEKMLEANELSGRKAQLDLREVKRPRACLGRAVNACETSPAVFLHP